MFKISKMMTRLRRLRFKKVSVGSEVGGGSYELVNEKELPSRQ